MDFNVLGGSVRAGFFQNDKSRMDSHRGKQRIEFFPRIGVASLEISRKKFLHTDFTDLFMIERGFVLK